MIYLDYKNRFRILRDQIIPDRLEQIATYHNDDYTERMINLTLKDTERLFNKACKDYSEDLDYYKLVSSQKELSKLLEDYFNSIDLLYKYC